MEIIGRHAVLSSLNEGIKANYLVIEDIKNDNLREIIERAKELNITIKEDRNFFNKFKRAAQGVALVIPEYDYLNEDELLSKKEEDRDIIIALDSIEDINNLGGIIRTASVFGIKNIIIPKDRAASVTPAVIKTAQGGLLDVKITRVTNLSRTLRDLKKSGYFIVGCHMEGEKMEHFIEPPVVIVIGSEHKGIRPGVLKECDKIHTIPMDKNSTVGCLNASVAASIILYEYFKAFKI